MKPETTLPHVTNAQILEWDSRFFDLTIARLLATQVGDDEMALALHWCRDNSVDCLYFLARSDDDSSVAVAEKNGFHLVDIRTTYQCSVGADTSAPTATHLRPYVPADLPFLQAIAQQSYGDSRFYYDAHFPRARVDELYRVWVEKSCALRPPGVLVAEHEGRPAGFITCEIDGERAGKIGLLGVDEAAQGLGLGRILVRGALDWFERNAATSIEVVTQGRNLRAQRLYVRNGFVPSDVKLWYHKWFGL